ncbi:Bcr/CflA family efflux MFS transporter [Bradyrhizobium sp. TM239]|uniref:Bcr/CflA family efflux MFS transporter n=1 Tax=Bradyrhizobium sp. TM239 TaxID=2599802 RepID=UPI0027D5B5CC|nr:Bcr/CflA family multidrug efflux MFS transporter [Bradyrhizobium sp. TM239]
MSSDLVVGKAAAGKPEQRTGIAGRGVICAFAAMGVLSTNIFLPSLPAMAADLGVSSAAVTSSITVFLVVFAAGQLIVGPLSDRFGRKVPIVVGICVFVLGTAGCAFAGEFLTLLVGRSVQAAGACAVAVLSRAIARDLFDGEALTRVMASITIATAAAPGFSPLLGGAIDLVLGWRFEFVFVAAVAVGAGAVYAAFVGETLETVSPPRHPLEIIRGYLGLVQDARFSAPARTAGLLMAGLYAVLSSAPRVLLEGFGLSPIALGWLFAGVVFIVFGAGLLAPRLSARFGRQGATSAGLALAAAGAAALLGTMLVEGIALGSFLMIVAVFLFGAGIASPLSSATALAPFGDKAGQAAALFGCSQMAGAACGAALAAILSSDPVRGLTIVLAATSLVALVLHVARGRRGA